VLRAVPSIAPGEVDEVASDVAVRQSERHHLSRLPPKATSETGRMTQRNRAGGHATPLGGIVRLAPCHLPSMVSRNDSVRFRRLTG
jgi:hypothetical protein